MPRTLARRNGQNILLAKLGHRKKSANPRQRHEQNPKPCKSSESRLCPGPGAAILESKTFRERSPLGRATFVDIGLKIPRCGCESVGSFGGIGGKPGRRTEARSPATIIKHIQNCLLIVLPVCCGPANIQTACLAFLFGPDSNRFLDRRHKYLCRRRFFPSWQILR